MNPSGRLLIGNLDGERELARIGSGLEPPTLPVAVLERLAILGSLLRVHADDGDRLWLPRDPGPRVYEALPELSRPEIVSDSLEKLPGGNSPGELLVWIDTPATDRLRDFSHGRGAISLEVNSRQSDLEIAERLGVRMPGVRLVESPEELRKHLRTFSSNPAWTGEWVLKPRFSAAGRWQHRGTGGELDADVAAQVRKKIEKQFGAMVFEPWQERVSDHGGLLTVGYRGAVTLEGLHRQVVDRKGLVRALEFEIDTGVDTPLDVGGEDGDLRPAELEHFLEVLSRVGRILGECGYRGPVSVDAWKYRTRDGKIRLNPLGEINARQSLGRLGRDLAKVLVERGRLPASGRVRFFPGGISEPLLTPWKTLDLVPGRPGERAPVSLAWRDPRDSG